MPSLGNDLKTLRTKKDLELEDIKKNTRIPVHILQSIENDTIFEQIEDNATYTRSYVRSYAKSIGIKENDIINALDQVEDGNYSGFLVQNNKEEPVPDPVKEKSSDAKEIKKKEQEKEKAKTEDKTPEPKKEQPPKEPKKEPAKKPAVKSEPKADRETPGSPEKRSLSMPKRPTSSDWDWVQVGQRAKASRSRPSLWTTLIIILIALAILAAGFLVYTYYFSEGEPANEPSSTKIEQPATPSDSLRQALTDNESKTAMAGKEVSSSGELPDTLSITILADNGELEPVRVYTDILDKRNPYWIAEGDSIRLNFVNTVRILATDQYDRIKLLFNGHVIDKASKEYYNEEAQLIELDRPFFKAHPEWRRAASL